MKHFLLCTFTFLTFYLQAQLTQTVRGQIIDKNSKSPIAGATVMVENSDPEIATATDDKGFFRLQKVPVGRQIPNCRPGGQTK